ncbi:MAG: GFA family protein [Acidobacteria bacterium]|nr:GFA family protein [Acidobacteriota bacterium]
MTDFEPFEGGCDCGQIRYRCLAPPLIVHGCHCRWCQRETGSAFAINAMLEMENVILLNGEPEAVLTPSASGKGQTIMRCPSCRIAVWSHYAGGGKRIAFIRVGTLDLPDRYPPDIHIFTSSKQPWLVLPEDAQVAEAFYDIDQVWSAASLARRARLREKKNQD